MDNTQKSKEEIIKELKSKGKYEEWIKLGSPFGHFNTTNVIDRLYKCRDVNDNIVIVTSINFNYNSNLNNIAIFNWILTKNPIFVSSGTYKIVDNNTCTLKTGGLLNTSIVLCMKFGNNKFLAHINQQTDTNEIVTEIKNILKTIWMTPNDIEDIKIYVAELNEYLIEFVTKEICSNIGIEDIKVNLLPVVRVSSFEVISY